MALIEPTSYVSVPPGLIYGECTLGELYQPLLQIVGWMWRTKWWQTTSRGLYTSVPELAERWGVADRSVYHRLQVYRDQGYLQTEFVGGGRVCLTLGPAALNTRPREAATQQDTPREAANYTPGEPANTMPREVATQQDRPREVAEGSAGSSCNQVAREPEVRATGLHEPINTNSSCSSLSNPAQQEKLQLLTTSRVRPREARERAADPWVTVERIQGWVAVLEKDPSVRSVGAVLNANLREHWEPPGLPAVEDTRSKAERLGVCPSCWQSPCVCEEGA